MYLAVAGIILSALVLLDLIYTAFSSLGAGFITKWVSQTTWKFLLFLSKSLRVPKLMNLAGLIIVCIMLLQWVFLTWIAHVLIAVSDDYSIVNSNTKAPTGLLEKIYVTGYNLSTLGNGDYMGGSPMWKLFFPIGAFTGLIMVTVALTYLIQVFSNVNGKRNFSSYVSGLGNTPEDLLLNAWNGKDFSALNNHLLQLNKQLSAIHHNHMSFPVLHFYYSSDEKTSVPVTVSILDEAITILNTHVQKEVCPDALTMQLTRNTVTDFLSTLNKGFIKPSDAAQPSPQLSKLERRNVPLQKNESDTNNANNLRKRRELLLGFLEDEGRDWTSVYGKPKADKTGSV